MLHMMSLRNKAEVSVTTPAPCPAVTQDPILSAAYSVLLDRGSRQATMTEIAKQAGVSRMTLYRRHSQLEGLLSEVLTAELGAVMADARAAAGGSTDREHIAATVALAAQGIARHPLMRRIVATDPQTLLPFAVARRGSTQVAAETMLEQMLELAGDGTVHAEPGAARAIVTAASGFVLSENLALDEGDTDRWIHLHRMIAGYLS